MCYKYASVLSFWYAANIEGKYQIGRCIVIRLPGASDQKVDTIFWKNPMQGQRTRAKFSLKLNAFFSKALQLPAKDIFGTKQ